MLYALVICLQWLSPYVASLISAKETIFAMTEKQLREMCGHLWEGELC